ncbi:hypothetical protein [Rhizohabitans arisaemae]|uniref:hypothetical protein n=1 Tax=Rhizohabitans arisaemae TaxID=2720610 RepID=UPI0024B21566|nr:hypothetical protein [Rhizohabitans arisaemae]
MNEGLLPLPASPDPWEQDEAALTRRYRKLLAWYPRDHRARHEEEMIGVLLAGAHPGQRHPGLGDTADLAKGALHIRLQRAFGPTRAADWQRASLIAGVIGLVLQATVGLGAMAQWAIVSRVEDSDPALMWTFTSALALFPLIVIGAMRTNRRWLVAGLAWTLLAAEQAVTFTVMGTYLIPAPEMIGPNDPLLQWPTVLSAATAISLTLAKEPWHSLKSLRWSRITPVLGGLIAYGTWVVFFGHIPVGVLYDELNPQLFATALAAGLALRSATGRRALLFLSPALVSLMYFAFFGDFNPPIDLLTIVGLIALAVTASRFRRARGDQTGEVGDTGPGTTGRRA